MNEVQTPRELLAFIQDNGRSITAFQVAVVASENASLTQARSHKILTDVHVSASDTPEDIARHVCTLAYADITERKSTFGIYRVTANYSDRSRKSKHFKIALETDAAADENHKPCKDCGGSGEYVGFSDRGTCETCGGSKVVRA